MAFEDKARIPVRPLDYKKSNSGALAMNKEMMVDYDTGAVYVKDKDGNVHNIYSSDSTKVVIEESIARNPELVTNAKIYDTEAGDYFTATVKEVITEIMDSIANVDIDDLFKKSKNNTVTGETTFAGILKIDVDNPNICGPELPPSGTKGQVFFLLVNE